MIWQDEISVIKTVPIYRVLAQNGVYPAYTRADAYKMYTSPYRADSHPSFKVNTRDNTWHDFGTGESGDVIDLVKKINHTDFAGAVKILSEQEGLDIYRNVNSSNASRAIAPSPQIYIRNVVPLRNPALLRYLQERCVDLAIAQQHCRELHYSVAEKTFFGIGFKNDRGGWEIRNKYCKQATTKDITTLQSKAGVVCNVFEGFIDYLSYLTLQRRQGKTDVASPPSVVVLNSIVNIEKAQAFLQTHARINAFLDNDDGGRRATQRLREMLGNDVVRDYAPRYAPHNDVNDYLKSQPIAPQVRPHVGGGMKM